MKKLRDRTYDINLIEAISFGLMALAFIGYCVMMVCLIVREERDKKNFKEYYIPYYISSTPEASSTEVVFEEPTVIDIPIIVHETIIKEEAREPAETLESEVTPEPTKEERKRPKYESLVTYNCVLTAFGDEIGSRDNKLSYGDCAAGRRPNGDVNKYDYIPYGTVIEIYFPNGETRTVTVKDDCASTNEKKIPIVKAHCETAHVNWSEIKIWLDIWVGSEDNQSEFGCQQAKCKIISWGEWRPDDNEI